VRVASTNRGALVGDPFVTAGSERHQDLYDKVDIVADRHSLLLIGMAAVWLACLVFASERLALTLRTGQLTSWWANGAGLLAITMLYLWYRRRPQTRSPVATHGTALVATLALLAPIAYCLSPFLIIFHFALTAALFLP
jgi:hypothetical protein